MRYIYLMSNAQSFSRSNDIQQLVAANLGAELRRKRWSDRQAATALGLSNVYVSRRTSGSVELSASDLAMFADFLEIPITKLFEGTKKAPSRGGLGASLPDLDSNQEPADIKSAPSFGARRDMNNTSERKLGLVTELHRNAS